MGSPHVDSVVRSLPTLCMHTSWTPGCHAPYDRSYTGHAYARVTGVKCGIYASPEFDAVQRWAGRAQQLQ